MTTYDDIDPSFLKKNFIGVQSIYNVVLVSGVQQSESVIHIHISTLFFFFLILFPYRLLQSIEQSSLCYQGSYQLSILYTVVCICQCQSPSLSLPTSIILYLPNSPPLSHNGLPLVQYSLTTLTLFQFIKKAKLLLLFGAFLFIQYPSLWFSHGWLLSLQILNIIFSETIWDDPH